MSRFIITISILIISKLLILGFSGPSISIDRVPFEKFPKVIGDWNFVTDERISKNSLALLNVDDYIFRTYENKTGQKLCLYIGYFKTQNEGKQIHSPRLCLTGSGWEITNHRDFQFFLDNERNLKRHINVDIVSKGNQKQLYIWWYHGRGRIFASEYLNKVYFLWDALTIRRTDCALVRVNMTIDRNINETLATSLEFIRLFTPLLTEYVPD